ncbi:bifunctional 4-hydroxy-2-oxoglutarate aldolase/2-dehydro-3-deoxy-phosphogluconate aldolase [Coralloluteibacterium stylophorae]|uniref:2-dehydro-3-deoxy-phosphogluconate aldolase n=1 Tax=Coralloluteibacterium stylophorae TaxID=1776034 RepID=A0A8J7VUK0_9GAMM|nr:bifunctional 4-hydroxy-2-oxoglutarate aldolase/2-dehydro-3-deoxy-phosphogluconate aldolase [Coralloluteibacterium stylophorae]MBS7456150.1 bifunctional 4-hydroxy-2-oxoglutarate aldolase/2-dehydro-3-deoxy-phosphogluconate aldolase [Coralloluteibacterium stylophorae]
MTDLSTLAGRQAEARELMRRAGVLPVVTVASAGQGVAIARALVAGGLPGVEVTLRSPAALDAIAAIREQVPDAEVGAGTVLGAAQLRQALDAGAGFIVSPGTPADVAEAFAEAPVPVIPGAATPTELIALYNRGFRVAKLFPASSVGGVGLLKSLQGPLPGIRICPTGGIGPANAADYLALSNVGCIGGSWMLKPEWLDAGDFAAVTAAAREARAIVDRVRAG